MCGDLLSKVDLGKIRRGTNTKGWDFCKQTLEVHLQMNLNISAMVPRENNSNCNVLSLSRKPTDNQSFSGKTAQTMMIKVKGLLVDTQPSGVGIVRVSWVTVGLRALPMPCVH